VVVNQKSKDSVEIGNYYVLKRKIPKGNICRINVDPKERITHQEYERYIRDKVRNHLDRNKMKGKIDYIVTTKGVPLATDEGSVDSALTCVFSLYISNRTNNPFYRSTKHFSFKDYGFVMVTRLDGYSVKDVKRLIDSSLKVKPVKGSFVFDVDPARDGRPGYGEFNDMMRSGSASLKKRGFKTVLDTSPKMCPGTSGVMGYYTWGSNDAGWDYKRYTGHSYLPGAIAETLVSTSARSFHRVKGGQSMIADLIAKGITGVKGYCDEPYSISLARGDILFDRYTRGFNLAESFYAASPFLYWKDVVIGDPLCAPYKSRTER
jgi:uncharacterized protein (TIGR03790 family)